MTGSLAEGGDRMGQFPPSFFQDPHAFEQLQDILEDEAHEHHGNHEHGPDCGHEAIEHGDHVDYLHDGHRHFSKDGIWHHHRSGAG